MQDIHSILYSYKTGDVVRIYNNFLQIKLRSTFYTKKLRLK